MITFYYLFTIKLQEMWGIGPTPEQKRWTTTLPATSEFQQRVLQLKSQRLQDLQEKKKEVKEPPKIFILDRQIVGNGSRYFVHFEGEDCSKAAWIPQYKLTKYKVN